MQLGLVTTIAPRLELDHLAEWLRHHASLGIGNFWIYSTGHGLGTTCPSNSAVAINPSVYEGDCHAELKDDEVNHRIRRIIKQATRLFGARIKHYSRIGSPQNHEHGQRLVFDNAVQAAIEKVDWLCVLSIGELLVSDLNYLKELPKEITLVRMKQKDFESRWHQGEARPMAAVCQHYGINNSILSGWITYYIK